MEGYSQLGSLLLKLEVDGKIITDLDEMLSSLSSLAGTIYIIILVCVWVSV
ncbi:hypothetical protein [Peribacillus simplex]|uniref:hypothetical protein n=1 Tax=Peribacillus simplex TaxID=1478 RepID=UPI0016251901|nr:hypothetical protein [Peribacillus simplex]